MSHPSEGERSPSGADSLPEEPILEVDEIQGNILAGFNKDHQVLLGLRIRGLEAARAWLARIEPEIATTAEVLRFNDLFRALRARRGKDPAGLVATWVNIAFSFAGLRKLTSEEELAGFPDDENAFRLGLPERSLSLHDPADPGAEGHQSHWVVGGPGKVPDILLIIASDDPAHLAAAVARVRPSTTATSGGEDGPPEVIYEEQGDTRPDLPGHEHFGYKDGVSQPGIRGRTSDAPDAFLTPRWLDPAEPDAAQFGRPGQPLIWPGQFVFGYPPQNRVDGSVLEPLPLSPSWVKNGSFLVFRRLRQDVQAFRDFVKAQADALSQQAGFHGMSPERFGAMLVGRWASGAPIMRTPDHDDEEMAANSAANNQFLFERATPSIRLRPGTGQPPDRFPQAVLDLLGAVCPHAAHIRKVNPRDEGTDLGDEFDTLTRRIIRRGIPFGPPLPDPAPLGDDGNRGLHFLCYQTSITEQFERLTQDWVNADNLPRAGGPDPLIGQQTSETGSRERRLTLVPRGNAPDPGEVPPASGNEALVTLPRDWVIPTGGGYFFAPSLSALRERLARSDPRRR
jgi:Dyp-type peroxidase family